nr:integrase, catalytic region, zinc finger, CCHC-type, peptidase aspartic, catalytic [Tanacetum cinerariifolium]
MTLNEEISNLNKQLSKEKSFVSFLIEEKKKLKSDFKTRAEELLDKQIQLEKKIKELNNILFKMGQSIQTIHMLSPKPDSFYHIEHKMDLGYQNPFYLKQAQKKQQSLNDGKVLPEKHDPPVVHDSEETLQLAQESREKTTQFNKEIKPANYTKINNLLGKEAAKFVRDFKSLGKEANESLVKQKALELEIERLLRAVVSQDIMSVVQKTFVVDTSNLQTELERTKERFETCIIKKENEYAKLWNDWVKVKILLVYQIPLILCLGVELEFQVLNYARENAHLKATYKNLFDSISMSRTQTKTIIASFQKQLHNSIYKNAKLSAQLFNKVYDQKDNKRGTSANTKFAKQSIVENLPKVGETHALSKPVTSNSVLTPQESKVVKNDKVIALGMFRINPFNTSREEKHVPNIVRVRIYNTKTRRPQPMSNTKNDRVPSASKSSRSKNKDTEVEEHHRNFMLSKNMKHMSSACNNIKLDSHNVISKVVCAMCKQCLISVNHDVTTFSTRQFYDSNLEDAFRRNACFIRNLDGVDLLKGDRSINLYTINLHGMASASPICLMDRASSSKLWLWHQHLSHHNFDTINDLARNDLVSGLLKFKYHKEHLCPSCEQGKKQKSISSTQTNSKFKAEITSSSHGFMCSNENCQYKWALCYPKNDREDIGKLGAKGDIGFSIGYSSDSCAYRVYNRRTKKIIETMNVSFNELSAMAFKQRSSKPGLQSMTSGQISSGLDLTYAPSTLTEGKLDLLFEAMYDDYIGGQSLAAARTVSPAQEPQDVDELNPYAMFDGNSFVNPFATSSTNAAESSSSQNNVKESLTDPAWIDSMQEERL